MAKSKIICLDNNITAFALRDDAHPDDNDKVEKSRKLIEILDEAGKIILLPAPVIAECLAPVPPQDRTQILQSINRFMIGVFDNMAAVKCAELMYAMTPAEKKFKKKQGITKSQLKFDYMIAAIAIVNQAECIYSEDEGLRKFCKGYIDVRKIPDFPEQGSLFNE